MSEVRPNAREIEIAHEVDAAYVALSEVSETLEEAGERCRAFFAQKLAEYRQEVTRAQATEVAWRRILPWGTDAILLTLAVLPLWHDAAGAYTLSGFALAMFMQKGGRRG